tara:strand:- start:39 stop:278 length:240 start_codon:yes stop_codon:yes gene_type:complete
LSLHITTPTAGIIDGLLLINRLSMVLGSGNDKALRSTKGFPVNHLPTHLALLAAVQQKLHHQKISDATNHHRPFCQHLI